MIDVEEVLRAELPRLVDGHELPDWDAVVAGSGLRRERARRRLTAGAALVVAAAAIGLATPLGAAIARGLDGFSAWITGQPGSPASPAEQRAFDRANARSWIHFPSGTKLRHLATVVDPHDGVKVDLMGFRAGSTLCLRVFVTGKTKAGTSSCAPLADLRQSGSPVRVVFVDRGFGTGTKRAWFGIDRLRSSARQVTVGIVADNVSSVIVHDNSGRHVIRASSNAFLYVANAPEVGQRVDSIQARTPRGLVNIPFAPASFGFGGPAAAPKVTPGPTKVERRVHGGTIGWLDHREPRGQPLTVLPRRARRFILPHIVFGRVIAPDPARPVRIALTLSTSRNGGRATGLCGWMVDRGGAAGGGCAVRADVFTRSPLGSGLLTAGGSNQFATFEGLASDDVDHIVAFLANGQTQAVPLRDNVYLVDIARSKLPAKFVAYDSRDRVIGFDATLSHFGTGAASGPAPGRAKTVEEVTSATGSRAELLVGGSSDGGTCMYVRSYRDSHPTGVMVSCQGRVWHGQPLQIGTSGSPAEFIQGRVRPDVKSLRLNFADGSTTTVKPNDGFVLAAVSRRHLTADAKVTSIDGFNSAHRRVGHESFQPSRRR
jgi:hypothetical protein